MNEPLTRDEDADAILRFHGTFRAVLIRHRASRLELFFLLQFPDDKTRSKGLPSALDPMEDLESAAPASIRQHRLFKSIAKKVGQFMGAARQALASASVHALDPACFRGLVITLRRLDRALDHFDAAITASLTDVDELTGLLNRAAMERDLARELAHARRGKSPLCVAMVDADHFKKVNDTYGHGFGDVVLEELADRFEAALRPHDRVYRYGGEEFMVMLPETALRNALQVVDRLRQAVCETPISEGDMEIVLTVSAGVALARDQDENEDVIKRADEALYEAKASGRNRVVSWGA